MVRSDLAVSIQRALQQLPVEKQVALKEFAEFLLQQTLTESGRDAARERFIARFINSPIKLLEFTPLTRDDIYRQ